MNGDRQIVVSDEFRRLVSSNAPLWAGEAEVIGTYFRSALRTHATDRQWVLRQLYKEYWDGIHPPLRAFQQLLPEVEGFASRGRLLALAKVLQEEVGHYVLFANLYDLLAEPGAVAPSPQLLKELGSWPENDALMATRARHKADYGELGLAAYSFTEGGYCCLFREGMKLGGRGLVDEAIADVCRRVYEDEIDHMLLGIVGVDAGHLTSADFRVLEALTTEQLRQRIRMRNAQFGRPVSEARVEALCGGEAEPLAFDYERALRGGSGATSG